MSNNGLSKWTNFRIEVVSWAWGLLCAAGTLAIILWGFYSHIQWVDENGEWLSKGGCVVVFLAWLVTGLIRERIENRLETEDEEK